MFSHFFFLCGHSHPAAKMPLGYLLVKVIWYKVKCLSMQYIQHNVYLSSKYKYKQHCFDYKCDSLSVVELEWAVNLQEGFVG